MYHCSKNVTGIFMYIQINCPSRKVSLLYLTKFSRERERERGQSNMMASSDRNYSDCHQLHSLVCVLTIRKNAACPTRRSNHISLLARGFGPTLASCAACNGPRASRRLFSRGCYLVGSTYSREQ